MPIDFKDYYAVLGITRTADQTEIKRAFREQARKSHPDVNRTDPRAEERFKDINEAYEVLSDPQKRARYDQYGRDWQRYRETARSQPRESTSRTTTPKPGTRTGSSSTRSSTSGTRPSGSTSSTGSASSGRKTEDFEEWFTGTASPPGASWVHEEDKGSGNRFSDFFNMLFGSFTSRGAAERDSEVPHAQRGDDTEVAVPITLEESVTGTKRHVALQIPEPCKRCHGTGYIRGVGCPTCDATGVILNSKTLEVSIPKGVRTGSRVRLAGQGERGVNGGPNGDVYLNIEVQPDARFERQGHNLRQKILVPFTTAVLGGEVVVPTLDGRVSMTVPPGTQDGALFRLKGLGMPVSGSGSERGDILVETHVAVPTDVSPEERELFIRLRDLRQ